VAGCAEAVAQETGERGSMGEVTLPIGSVGKIQGCGHALGRVVRRCSGERTGCRCTLEILVRELLKGTSGETGTGVERGDEEN